MLSGSQFVADYAKKGLPAWEAAALELARQSGLVPWPWVDLTLVDGDDTAVLHVASDVLSVGTLEDHVRLPLTPGRAQDILNLSGALMPTPWLEYQIWRAASLKLAPTAMVPNRGADLNQYLAHSGLVDAQIANALAVPTGDAHVDLARSIERDARASRSADAWAVANDAWMEVGAGTQNRLVSGIKKGVVVANFYKPGKVLLFGWYRPPPAPDVFDDGRPMGTLDRQPIQPKSNVHGDFYVDYSHGIRAIAPLATVNGQVMSTVDLYKHPTLSRLVSNEGPVKVPRYPSAVPVAQVPVASVPFRPVSSITRPAAIDEVPRGGAPTTPGITEYALDEIARQARERGRT